MPRRGDRTRTPRSVRRYRSKYSALYDAVLAMQIGDPPLRWVDAPRAAHIPTVDDQLVDE